MASSWQLDELAHAGPEHLDPDFVRRYDRKQGHPGPAEDLDALRAHGLGPASTVVDLAAGTGQFTLGAAGAFGMVVAADVSPAMVEHLRAATAGLPNVRCVPAGFLTYEHAGPPADAVYTRNALHQVPDFWKARALHRIAGMLRPGGILRLRDLVYDFAPGEADTVFADWFATAVDDPEIGYTPDDLAEHIRTEHSTFRWLLEPILDATGFDVLDARYDRRVYAAYTCRRR